MLELDCLQQDVRGGLTTSQARRGKLEVRLEISEFVFGFHLETRSFRAEEKLGELFPEVSWVADEGFKWLLALLELINIVPEENTATLKQANSTGEQRK